MARKISRPINTSTQESTPAKPELHLDYDKLLTLEERTTIRARAKLKIEARDKEEASDRYLKEEMARLDKELHPEAEVQMVEFTPSLALFADAIRLDGRPLHHGHSYQIAKDALAVVLDIEYQTHRHHHEITHGGDNNMFYQRSREMSVNMSNGAATSAGRPVRF